MGEQSTAISVESIVSNESKRGGKRQGAGRKKLDYDARYMQARGITPLTAIEILRVMDEQSLWRRVLKSEDDRIVLQALMYLTDRRDGKPAQQINVTSQNVTISADSLERARAIVRELRGEGSAHDVLNSEEKAKPALVGDVAANGPESV